MLKGMGAALAVAVMTGQASAGLREYCDSYARDVAYRKTNGGAPVDRGESVGTSSIIGGSGGTILGAGVTGNRYKRAYTNAFERCVDNYEGQRARNETAEDKVAGTKVVVNKATETKVAESDEGSAGSWTKACARKYRSWDPQKGKYKSYSGKWKPCRL
ncbi:MAG: BA14K family protein [Parvibaculaceae bacterium]